MQNIGRRHSTRQLAIDRNIIRIDKIPDANFACNRLCGLVHTAISRHMRMTINDARRDMHSADINHFRTVRNFDVFADVNNSAFTHNQGSIVNHTQWPAGPNGCMKSCGTSTLTGKPLDRTPRLRLTAANDSLSITLGRLSLPPQFSCPDSFCILLHRLPAQRPACSLSQ